MVDDLSVMMIAVIIAIGVMMVSSKPLMAFVSKHPTVVILCLGFLLMIGFSLIVEGFGYHLPKGYLYAAIRLLDPDRGGQPDRPQEPRNAR